MKQNNTDLYYSTMERLRNMGVSEKDHFTAIVTLAREIEKYREKIDGLENRVVNLMKLNEEEREKNKLLSDRNRELAEEIKEWDETGCEPSELKETDVDDYTTYITIESRRKVSNVEVYFQED